MEKEPLLLAFCCHYCAYAAADLAGSMRLRYPPNVRVLRLPCTGKVEINFILAAFEHGIDGILVAGCLEGGCHFLEGNLRARKRVERAKELLDEAGLEPERLEMYNLSSADGPRFVEIVKEMTERLRKLGPSPLRPAQDRLEQGVADMARRAREAVAADAEHRAD
ncbi:MAG: hydrogenase iron-sulfur subunit [Kiritimatiellaeota bacterium]|nr:hydrogenase iron-sulfur subunit [Kiritimatiellota bacterium]